MRTVDCSCKICNCGCATKSTPEMFWLATVTVRLGGLKVNPLRTGVTVYVPSGTFVKLKLVEVVDDWATCWKPFAPVRIMKVATAPAEPLIEPSAWVPRCCELYGM